MQGVQVSELSIDVVGTLFKIQKKQGNVRTQNYCQSFSMN